MIFPDISIDKWLKKYPALEGGFPLCSCGEHNLRPYRTFKSAGIECKCCKTAVWVYAKDENNQHLLNLLTTEGSYSHDGDGL